MPKKLTINQVRAEFEAKGYTIVGAYENNHTPVLVRCPNLHERFMLLGNFKKGAKCAVCVGKVVSSESVQEYLRSYGWTLRGDYVGCNKALSVCCPDGHVTTQTWHTIKAKGLRCKHCSGVAKYTEEQVRDLMAQNGDTLLSPYLNRRGKIEFTCSAGHSHEMQFRAYLDGQRCPHCSGKRRLTNEIVQNYLTPFEVKLESQVTSNNSLLKMRCKQDHTYERTWTHIQDYSSCPYCVGTRLTCGEKLVKARIRSQIKNKLKTLSRAIPGSLYESKSKLANDLSRDIFLKLGKRPSDDIEWSIDHIVPVSWFLLSNPHEVRACWSAANVRWMPTKDNIRRGNKMKLEEIDFMSKNHPEIYNMASRKPTGLLTID